MVQQGDQVLFGSGDCRTGVQELPAKVMRIDDEERGWVTLDIQLPDGGGIITAENVPPVPLEKWETPRFGHWRVSLTQLPAKGKGK